MRKYKVPIAAIVFFIVSVFFIASYKSFHFFLPAQQVELSHGVQYGAVVKDFLFVQEITLQKRYISRIDLYMAKLPSQYSNQNVFLLLNAQRDILFTKRFSSSDFGEALYFPFDFNKQFDIGKGNKIYACVYSIDGDQGSYIGLAKKESSRLGKLSVVSIVDNDVVLSLEKQQGLVNFTGSIGARTYESDTRFFSMLQVVFYLLAIFIALFLFFMKRVGALIRRSLIMPEYSFLGFALVFGSIMLVITPPFMVPDEPVHFYRSWQVSEFNIYKLKEDFPKSLVQLSTICDRMQFSTHEKTTRAEILSLGNFKTDPAVRTTMITPDYTLPYVPQAIGIAFGRILGLSPLWLFYLGRLFNLLASVTLIFLAIRITPVFKWVFFLLGIMPMTLYQAASMSYDAMTIGLCFLFLATILGHMLRDEKTMTTREIATLFILSVLLAAAKQPYAVIVFTFLVVPVSKLGSLKRFLIVFTGLLISVAVVSLLWAPGRAVFEKFSNIRNPAVEIPMATVPCTGAGEDAPDKMLKMAMLPMLPHSPETTNAAQEQAAQQPAAAKSGAQPQPDDATKVNPQVPVNPIDPSSQKNYILHDPVRYVGILFHTLGKSLDLYLTSFVGLFGWIDAPLPALVAYAYLLFLVLFSIFSPMKPKGIGFLQKCLFMGVFLAGFILIETALYVYCNPVGCDPITAVQGRYFLAIAPLVFLLFANRNSIGFMQKILAPSSTKPVAKKALRKQPPVEISSEEMLFSKAMPWLAMLVALTTLICSVFVILERFYVISM
jgi:uncharacterized membrane protein